MFICAHMKITAWPLCLLLVLALAVAPSTGARKAAGALAVFAASPLAGAAIVCGAPSSSTMIGVQLALLRRRCRRSTPPAIQSTSAVRLG